MHIVITHRSPQGQAYPSRVPCFFQGKKGRIVLDQVRTVDKARLLEKLGTIGRPTQKLVIERLGGLFAA